MIADCPTLADSRFECPNRATTRTHADRNTIADRASRNRATAGTRSTISTNANCREHLDTFSMIANHCNIADRAAAKPTAQEHPAQ